MFILLMICEHDSNYKQKNNTANIQYYFGVRAILFK